MCNLVHFARHGADSATNTYFLGVLLRSPRRLPKKDVLVAQQCRRLSTPTLKVALHVLYAVEKEKIMLETMAHPYSPCQLEYYSNNQ